MTNKEAIKLIQEIEEDGRNVTFKHIEALDLAIKALEERPQGELTEINHRLNLLIGVLYSNQCISEMDLKYIEDSIKKLMKGGAE